LFNTYCEYYNVGEDKRFVPIIFFGNTYFYDEDIFNYFDSYLKNHPQEETPVLISPNNSIDTVSCEKMSIGVVFLAGLVNGINPCSISLFFFFISVVLSAGKGIRKASYAFLFGKFLCFFLLGTFLFNFLSIINFVAISIVVKFVIIGITIFLVLLNLYDFIMIRSDRIEKIKLQLPKKFIKINHTLIRIMTDKKAGTAIILLSLILGSLIASGEFLCTGQIYLSTIISILHYEDSFSWLAVFYLLIYASAFILPLIISLEIIVRGKTILSMSTMLVNRLDIIKLINIIVLIGFIVFYILY
jgi:hypothetical protein